MQMLVEPVVVTVTSETDPNAIYVVRLPERDGGACTCPDYVYRREPRGESCKHMRRAAAWWHEQEGYVTWHGSDHSFEWVAEGANLADDPTLLPA